MCPVTTVTICTVNTLFTATLEFLFQLQNNVKTVISFDFQELCTVRTCLIIIKKSSFMLQVAHFSPDIHL